MLRTHVPWRPMLEGENASTVVGPRGERSARGADEIHMDALGRIKVQYDFQRLAQGDGTGDATSITSTWVRVLQRYAGAGMGLQFIPRIGQEVLVDFIDRDMERPVVVAALYNGRGEGGVPATPGGRAAEADTRVFTQADDASPSATFSEYSKGSDYPYGAFYGRGLMQLTWASNYEKYGLFRQFGPQTDNYLDARISSTSTHLWEDKGRTKSWGTRYDPSVIETSYYNAGDSGGFYWVSKHFKGTSNISKIADLGHETFAVGLVSWAVNGGSNGYVERQKFFAFVFKILSDTPYLTGVVQLTYARFSQALMAAHPTTTQLPIASAQVNYEKQTP